MINPNGVNLVIYQSATFDKTIQWVDNGTVVDMTDYEVALQIRHRGDNGVVLLTASTMNGMIRMAAPVTGTFQFNIPAAITEELSFTNAVYDLLVKKGSRVSRIAQGEVMLSVSQTKLEAFL